MKKQTITYLSRSALLIGMLLPIIYAIPAVGQRPINENRTRGCIWTGRPLPGSPIPIHDEPVAIRAPTPYPTTIVRYGFAQTATYFYVFGGVSNGTRVNNVNRMDISTGMWQALAPMPFTSEAPTCALMASTNKVYCAEGDTGNGFASYDIASDTWTSLPNTPNATNNYGSASGGFNGKVFLAGGTTGFINNVWVYDVVANTWSAGTAAPNGFLLAGYAQVGQYLYCVGGWTGGGPTGLTTTTRLDMTSAPGVWSNGPAFPMGRADFGVAYDPGADKLYALGGDVQGGGFFDSTNEVDESPTTATWPAGTWVMSPPNLNPPNRQANQAGFSNGGMIWSVGGIVGQTFQFLDDVEVRSCSPCSLNVLIVYADGTGAPTGLQSETLAEPGVSVVDLFDGAAGTPTLAQLQEYSIVVPFSNNPFADATALGNNLADYVDGGGIVVQYGFSHYGPSQPYGVNGRWITGNYNPYDYSTNVVIGTAFTLGTFDAGHPLMSGVTMLNSNYQNIVTAAGGATEVAAASNGNSLIAYRPVSGGHTTVGVTAYVGAAATQSGHWGRVVVNAGIWLGANCVAPTVVSDVSRRTHGGAGTFDIAMPLTGPSGVECRTGVGATNDYSLVVTFTDNVTVTGSPQAQVTIGTGCVGSGGVCTGNVAVSGAVVTVPLTNIANAQVIDVRINGVNGTTNFDIPMGFLIGDTNGNRSVNAGDVAQTKARAGQAVNATNFRSDVNANGSINAGDLANVKQHSGTSIP